MTQTGNPLAAHASGLENHVQVAEKVVAVVVSGSGMTSVSRTLEGIQVGRLRPDIVIVINESSDELANLDCEIPTDVVHLKQSDGGFTAGIDRALIRHQADLIWTLDDGVEPNQTTLSALYETWKAYSQIALDPPAVVTSQISLSTGENLPVSPFAGVPASSQEDIHLAHQVNALPVRTASFASTLMDAAIVRREGLPLAGLSELEQAYEFTSRLTAHRVGLVAHQSTALQANDHINFGQRANLLAFPRNIIRSRSFSSREKIGFGSSVAHQLVQPKADSANEHSTVELIKQLIKDGASKVRSNQQVLAGAYELEFPGTSRAPEFQDIDVEDAQFSVLMATYKGEKPEYLEQAIASNTVDQTRRPDELVLVQDGPLTPELEEVINRWKARGEADGVPLKLVKLDRNMGLARALDIGLKHVSTTIVARADSDDISLPRRFEKQLPEFLQSGVSVLGGSMEESDASGADVESMRHATVGVTAISKAMATRNPIFHPTVMFDVRDVLAVGGYEFVPGAEDYWLWARMNREGYKIDNIDVPLVRYRAGAGAFTKRGGVQALQQDLAIQSTLYRGYIISPYQYAKNMAVRVIYRSLPTTLRANAFRTIIGGSRGTK